MSESIEVLVKAGKATPGPPLGPLLGPLGLNVKKVVEEINKLTSEYNGMRVPVRIILREDRSYRLELGELPVAVLLKQASGINKGSGDPGKKPVANLSLDEIVRIAKQKQKSRPMELSKLVKQILGTCISMGINVDGVHPKELIQRIESKEIELK